MFMILEHFFVEECGGNDQWQKIKKKAGCTIADNLDLECPAEGLTEENHGAFVSCVADLTNSLKKAGALSGQQKGAIQSCAAGYFP